jgi:hypothetical protein
MTGGGKSMSACCEVELDIFSGMPNPTWTLTTADADTFLKQVDALPPTSAKQLSGNLGYRGFIVQCTKGAEMQIIRIQTGIVHISKGATVAYALDENRQLERWLLNTARRHLKNEVFQIVEREFR